MKLFILVILTLFSIISRAQSVPASIGKGNKYYKQSEFELAERFYRQALKKAPEHTTATYNLAISLYRQKRYDEAEEILKSMATQSKDKSIQSSAYYNTGVIHNRQKNLEASIEAYKNALRLNPDDRQARENLQKALLELKQQQQQERKDQQEAQKRQSRMSQNEAEKKLQQLQEKEKRIQERMQTQKSGNPMPKDW